jgi:hypothetical protein
MIKTENPMVNELLSKLFVDTQGNSLDGWLPYDLVERSKKYEIAFMKLDKYIRLIKNYRHK